MKNAPYTVAQFTAQLAQGGFAWPGGYPLFFVTSDGGALSFESAQKNAKLIESAIADNDSTGGWQVVACQVNWEDAELYCDDTGKRIPSAYAEPEPDIGAGNLADDDSARHLGDESEHANHA